MMLMSARICELNMNVNGLHELNINSTLIQYLTESFEKMYKKYIFHY